MNVIVALSAKIAAIKQSGTDANDAGDLVFYTSANAATASEESAPPCRAVRPENALASIISISSLPKRERI